MNQPKTLKVDSPDFPRSVQNMIVYFTQERGDPSRHMEWDKYEPLVKRDWPEFYAAFVADAAYGDFGNDATHEVLQTEATKVKAALDQVITRITTAA